MNIKKITVGLIILLIFLSSSINFAQGKDEEKIANFFSNSMKYHLENENIIGGIVTVVKDNEVILNEGYGYADIEAKILANGYDVAYEIGSISKTFVALSALKLVEEGNLDLNIPISEYLNDEKLKFNYSITMHDLLTHSAGFEDQVSGLGMNTLDEYKNLKYYLINFKPNQVFKPGEVTSYSNYGIGLAAYVIETIVDQPYYTVVEEDILKPLDMTHTTFQLGEIKTESLAKGYKNNGMVGTEQYVSLYPAGGANSTGEDMGKYLKFLLSDDPTLLSQNLKEQLFKKQFSMVQSLEGIGYTWNRDIYNHESYYRKKGERQFTKSKILIYPSENIGVFISINNAITTEYFENLTKNINDLILGESNPKFVNSKNSHDISGCYVSTKSSFSKEKFLNVLVPNKIICIETKKDDFFIQDQALKMLENNTFMINNKILKYIEKNNSSYLISNGAESYIKLPWYEGKGWQLFSISFFILMSLITFSTAIRKFLTIDRNQKGQLMYSNLKYVPGILMIVFAVLFIISIFILINSNFNCLVSILTFLSYLISINAILFLLLLKILNINESVFTKILNYLSVLSNLIFIFWLYNMNLIL